MSMTRLLQSSMKPVLPVSRCCMVFPLFGALCAAAPGTGSLVQTNVQSQAGLLLHCTLAVRGWPCHAHGIDRLRCPSHKSDDGESFHEDANRLRPRLPLPCRFCER